MKNKALILNISLVILLIVSLIGNLILFNQFKTSKQTLADLKNELEESKVKLQNAQLDWKTLETNITSAKEDNKQLQDLKDSRSSVAVSGKISADPNKQLSSGITLWEAKTMVDEQIDRMKDKGYSAEDLNRLGEMMAKELGTTMDEINRTPDTPVVQQPSTNTQKPSTQQPTQQQSGGSQLSPEEDKNGNGIVDFLEDSYAGEGNGTVSDPDFNLGTNP